MAFDEARRHRYAREINQQQAHCAGFGMHLSKPVELEELIKAIARLLIH
jgi:CheY-like chemotaxis protein